MKAIVHKADARGFADYGWLQANHSFSFANFHNPKKMQFGALRVLNDDTIAPKMGFSTHAHDNMEIITIPLKGELKHKDSMANSWLTVKENEVQVMSAGSGLEHSEINGSLEAHLSLFQIWIIPNKENVSPRYDQKNFEIEGRKNKLQILVSSIDEDFDGSLKIHQDAIISRIDLSKDENFIYNIKSSTHGVYVMNIDGEVEINSENLKIRDAIGVSEVESFEIKSKEDSKILFIEVPMHL